MSRVLITGGLFTEIPAGEAPAEIVFIPEGRHTLTPKSHPKGVKVNLPPEKGEAIAAAFNADLAKRGNVGGWCDFEHTRRHPVSFYPTGYRYEKGRGVMVAADWSSSGKTAVEGRDVRFFSPEFYIGPDGVPNGLPDRGPLGGLVTEPAFRDIPAIAASDADFDPTPADTMKDLVTCGLLTDTEAARENAAEIARQRVTAMKGDAAEAADLKTKLDAAEKERDELKTKVTAAEAEAKKAAEKRADDLVKAAVLDGRIPPKDEKGQGFYKRLISAGDADAEDALAGLPKRHAGLDNPLIQARQGEGGGDNDKDDPRSPLDRLACALADNDGK